MNFKGIFNIDAEVKESAHARVNLIGEHTDYTGGYVMPTLLSFKIPLRYLKIILMNSQFILNILKKKKYSMISKNQITMSGLII